MAESDKILSVVVPSFNMERYLEQCCTSVIVDDATLLHLLEVIIVNDGSKDGTSRIAHGFEAKYPDVIHVIDKANGHYGSCVNAALKVAKGRYLRILDADDSFDKKFFEAYLAILKGFGESDEPDAIINGVVSVDENGGQIGEIKFDYLTPGFLRFSELPDRVVKDFMLQAPFAYRTDLLRSINYRQTEGIAYTDAQWSTIPMAAVNTVYYFPGCLYRYLCGRAGQSMDAAVMVNNNYWMSGMTGVDSYRALDVIRDRCETRNVSYVERRALSMICSAYQTGILCVHNGESDARLSKMDDQIKVLSPSLYDAIETQCRLFKGTLRYVKAWRKKKSSNSLSVRFIRFLREVLH